MQNTLYFYDLETTGISAKKARIMQFAGQRTDLDLNPIGEPDNILIKLTPDILPDPEAILITGITPQQTLQDGISEVEFLKYFHSQIALPGTVFVGYNTIRFDDEFIRYLNYRNFYDAYEWQWQESRSRWDILDVVRMTRALRPDGIKWPVNGEGKPVNSLEPITKINNLEHSNAHDALSDVNATISVAKLIKTKQPKLFKFLYDNRDKKSVEKLVSSGPFVYTSGRYGGEFNSTTIATAITDHPNQKGSVFVYDLRYDPTEYTKMTPEQLSAELQVYRPEEGKIRIPIKQLQFNRCPSVAPMGVLGDEDKKRLSLDIETITKNYNILKNNLDFGDKVNEAIRINEKLKQQSFEIDVKAVDEQLYDGFFNDSDKTKMSVVRASGLNELADLNLDFADNRLEKLLLLYKARQFKPSLTDSEQASWSEYLENKLITGEQSSELAKYFAKIQEISQRPNLGTKDKYLLEELKLYGESIIPVDY